MKKIALSLTLAASCFFGAAQLFADEQYCLETIYCCEETCAVDFYSTPWDQCMDWCVPSQCSEYL